METTQKKLNENQNFEPKTKVEGKKNGSNLTYEDIISQTKEIAFNVVKTEKKLLEEESAERKAKLEALEQQYKDLNAKPLASIDSYENYNLVLNKSVWNYNEIKQRNTKFTFKDLVLQTHIYIYDGSVIEIPVIEQKITNFLNLVFESIIKGAPVILNPILIIDSLRFDKNKIVPVTIANPKLLPPLGVIEWQHIVPDKDDNFLIIDAFIKLIDSALANGHEVEFFPETVMVRGISGITSMYVSEKAALSFNRAASSYKPTSTDRNGQPPVNPAQPVMPKPKPQQPAPQAQPKLVKPATNANNNAPKQATPGQNKKQPEKK